MSARKSPDEPSNAVNFATTHWSVVLAAARGDVSSDASKAMAELCRIYWYPLYAFVRRQGRSPEDAHDLTQAAGRLQPQGHTSIAGGIGDE